MAEETPSEGHDKVRKKINVYKTAVDVNKKQKELKKKKKETNTTVDEYEGKFKSKIESYTKKTKDAPKQFKEAARNQLSQLIETFKMSASDGEDPSSNSETETIDVNKLKKEEAELEKELKTEQAKTPKPDARIAEIKSQLSELDKQIGKANFSQLKTDSAKNATEALRNTFIQTVNRTKERLQQVLFNETVSALGCSQEQNYETNKPLYIKVSSIDVFGKTLQTDPNTSPGQYIYEVNPFNPKKRPYSFNRELYNRLQNPGKSYKEEYNVNFLGATNQELFNITYVKDPTPIGKPQLYGDYYKVELSPRVSGEKVVDFLNDYLNSIDILNFNELYSNVLNLLTGSISIKLKTGEDDLRSQTEFEKILQRILGLCFDNKQEIDVSGSGKLDPLDQIDDSFFVLSPREMVEVENKVKNVLESVVQYRDCGTLSLPVNADANLGLLDKFFKS
jgi:hypothetical protein